MSIKENGEVRIPSGGNLVSLDVPGMYTLPDHLLQKKIAVFVKE